MLALLFTYPLICDTFWWGWRSFVAVSEALFVGCYLCFGFSLQLLLPRFRWPVWSSLLLTVLFVTPRALLPSPFESESALPWFLRAILGCCLFLFVSTAAYHRATSVRVDK
jgi:hypothetical protein